MPQVASSGFQTHTILTRMRRGITPSEVEGELEMTGEFCDELLVCVRLRATNSVMKMRHGNDDPQFRTKFQQDSQQSH